MEEGQQFILTFAVGQEEREKYRKIAGADEDVLGDFLCYVAGILGVSGNVLDRGTSAERHQLLLLYLAYQIS